VDRLAGTAGTGHASEDDIAGAFFAVDGQFDHGTQASRFDRAGEFAGVEVDSA